MRSQHEQSQLYVEVYAGCVIVHPTSSVVLIILVHFMLPCEGDKTVAVAAALLEEGAQDVTVVVPGLVGAGVGQAYTRQQCSVLLIKGTTPSRNGYLLSSTSARNLCNRFRQSARRSYAEGSIHQAARSSSCIARWTHEQQLFLAVQVC